jgi:hypothetical protein
MTTINDIDRFRTNKFTAANKNYMSIGVSVRTTKFATRNSGGAARQGRSPQSATVYSFVRCQQA